MPEFIEGFYVLLFLLLLLLLLVLLLLSFVFRFTYNRAFCLSSVRKANAFNEISKVNEPILN